jgi:MarR family transcriptional regulator, organic hydroperoxide resistance regulator
MDSFSSEGEQMTKSLSDTACQERFTQAPPHNSNSPQAFPVMDERGRTVAWVTRTVHRLYNIQTQKILDLREISIAHWFYLRVLAERGEVNQLELSKRVGIASTTAVSALDNMEKRGLLRRYRDPKDRRKYYVRLTPEGRQVVDDLLPPILQLISESISNVTSDEIRVFWKVLHEIENTLSKSAGINMID